jgi:hypothetical protein
MLVQKISGFSDLGFGIKMCPVNNFIRFENVKEFEQFAGIGTVNVCTCNIRNFLAKPLEFGNNRRLLKEFAFKYDDDSIHNGTKVNAASERD